MLGHINGNGYECDMNCELVIHFMLRLWNDYKDCFLLNYALNTGVPLYIMSFHK